MKYVSQDNLKQYDTRIKKYISDKSIDLEPYALTEEVDKKLKTKVDKVTGKELSTNDFTDSYKTSLDNWFNRSTITPTLKLSELDTKKDITTGIHPVENGSNQWQYLISFPRTRAGTSSLELLASQASDYLKYRTYVKDFDGISSWKTLATTDVATSTSNGLMSKEDKVKLDSLSPKEQLFIDMWNSACGTNGKYNTETGFYELNGLTDITYEQALTIYNEKFTFTKYMDGSLGNNLSRTNLSNGLNAGAQSGGLTLKHFGANSKYEVFNFGWAEIYNGSQIFRNNIRLKKIMNAWFFSGIDPQTIAFASSNLESLLIKLGGNINLSNLAKLTYETFDYIIKNSTNTTELTIKVHPTTYAYLQGTTPPTEQVGGTTEQWQALVTAATNKKISFATS